jgi:hypothetical protein
MANQRSGKAAPDSPALKPYRGKPAIRNFRGDGGNVGIIEARLAPPSYSTTPIGFGRTIALCVLNGIGIFCFGDAAKSRG